MHTVIETPAYLADAKDVGLGEAAMRDIVDAIANDPSTGDLIPGTGGCRKLRWGRDGRGKRGGVRIITFYSGVDIPVFLLTVFAKNEASDLSKAEQNALGTFTKLLVSSYATKAKRSAS